MYIIEKCLIKNVDAKYSTSENHLWVKAWSGKKSIIDSGSASNAIAIFKERTLAPRTVPYRLITMRDNIVLAAINANDADSFKKYAINAIGFKNKEANTSSEVINSCSATIETPITQATQVKLLVSEAAEKLQSAVTSHKVITRYNSDRESGGAWLVTSITDGIMSNSDVGITFSSHTNNINLLVANKYLNDECHGNDRCPWTELLGHNKSYSSIDEAVEMLVKISKQATQEELKLLAS